MFDYIIRLFHPENFRKAAKLLHDGGPRLFTERLKGRLQYKYSAWRRDYRKFREIHRPSATTLYNQRHRKFEYQPCFGIIIPLYNTKEAYLRELLESFQAQTYSCFKLFLIDASPLLPQSNQTALSSIVASYTTSLPIEYIALGKNYGISGNTNEGFKLALKDKSITHVALCDHDDYLEPTTLFEYAKYLNFHRSARVLYCDEDVVAYKDDPNAYYVVKPDFNRFLLESCNYINHFFVFDKSLLPLIKTTTGEYERSAFNGAQDYDLYLRLLPHATFHHIPKILYHWRASETSTAKDPQNKSYAYESGERALTEYFHTQSVPIQAVSQPVALGSYRVDYQLSEQPLISIITSDPAHTQFLDSFQADDYQNFEIVTSVESASPKSQIFLFLDSSLRPRSSHILTQLVATLQRDHVGCVAGQILFHHQHIEHAGLVIGIKNCVGNIFYDEPLAYTYNSRADLASEYSAVSGSCLMIKKSTYKKLGGLNSDFGGLADVDLCLRLRESGLSIVYNPTVSFQRVGKPCPKVADSTLAAKLRDAHPDIFTNGDPFYNPNLSRDYTDCRLRV